MIKKVLIAGRGEIAVRVIRACREMGIATVAVYSEVDKDALHTQLADQSICIGGAPARESYLNMERIISATIVSGADAIHPGFGFLSENSTFARWCEKCNIIFIGPSSSVIEAMGHKSMARAEMTKASVPIIPGSTTTIQSLEEGKGWAKKIGFPLMIKAALGGGGKGMRVAQSEEDFENAFLTAKKEALMAFGNDEMYIERLVLRPRHIEFQILADSFGNVIHLGERDCSLQRNHQKLIEEAPSMVLNDELRSRMGASAVAAAKAVGYVNAGTIEFLLEESGAYYFMEMNTRIQVEHPITEFVTGIDIVKEQIRIASGLPLSYTQDEVHITGHAIECRINAQDPNKGYRPSPGTITDMYLPGGFGVRVDSAIYSGYTVPPHYDSMLAKLIVHADNRQEALSKMRSALGEVIIEGIQTNVDAQYDLLNHQRVVDGTVDIDFVESLSTC